MKKTKRKSPTKTRVRKPSKTASKISSTEKKAILANRKAHWDVYRKLQKQVSVAWEKLKTDINKKADPTTLLRDRNRLLLLLGECNYMTLECSRLSPKK